LISLYRESTFGPICFLDFRVSGRKYERGDESI